jgi:hypothetical protein
MSPIKSQRKVAINSMTARDSTIQNQGNLNGKHSRSSAHLDVAQINLSARLAQNESPVIKRNQKPINAVATASSAVSYGKVQGNGGPDYATPATFDAHRKA